MQYDIREEAEKHGQFPRQACVLPGTWAEVGGPAACVLSLGDAACGAVVARLTPSLAGRVTQALRSQTHASRAGSGLTDHDAWPRSWRGCHCIHLLPFYKFGLMKAFCRFGLVGSSYTLE